MKTRPPRRAACLALLLAVWAVGAGVRPVFAGGQASKAETQVAPAAKGELRPAPLGPRDRVGVYVFMASLWAIVAFLLVVLRMRIREADRVFATGLYPTGGGEKAPRRP